MSSFLYIAFLTLFVTAKAPSTVSTEVSLCYELASTSGQLDFVIFKRVHCNDGNVSLRFESKEYFFIAALVKNDEIVRAFVRTFPPFNTAASTFTTTDTIVTPSVTPPSSHQALGNDVEVSQPFVETLPAFLNAATAYASTTTTDTPSVVPPSITHNDPLNTSPNVTLSCTFQQPIVVTSPDYPQKYKNNVIYHLTVQAEQAQVIRLTFEDFNIEVADGCIFDHVQIYDGFNSTTAQLTEKLCGRQIPPPVTSTTNIMHIYFETDYSVRKRGFQAVAECV